MVIRFCFHRTEDVCTLKTTSAVSLDFCPPHPVFAKQPEEDCETASDPNNLKKSPIEKWFTREMFEHNLSNHLYMSLQLSYFKDYEAWEHQRRDVAAFFAHVLQETGENDISLYNSSLSEEEAAECFYRGGFYNWFERGPNSSFLIPAFPGFQTVDGKRCTDEGRYCKNDPILNFWYPCNGTIEMHSNVTYYKGCYFGRGALQLSWNYNYGLFQQFLLSKGISVDLINNPNLVRLRTKKLKISYSFFLLTYQPNSCSKLHNNDV
ncbi:unnamed protein product [Strongylus vulgaris]|uniref:Glycoside hydrolase family 19 catalytic domain-containing protein n=1 Tax=Strongylus vulgaris TaxID=40348 RepID=A0A3P7LMW6_STRVU|nr:unnamed protein product [Strongylus vulgaris]